MDKVKASAPVVISTACPRTAYNPRGGELGPGGQQAFKWVNQVASHRVDCQVRVGGDVVPMTEKSELPYAGVSLTGPVKVVRPGCLPQNPEYTMPKDEN